MTDIASLGIAVNTAGVTAADAALDRLAKAAIDATNAVQKMTAAAVANASQAGGAAKQILSAASAHNALGAAAIKSTAALHGHTAGMMNARMGMMEFEHSIRSIIDGLGAGMSPMRLMAMEGSRLAQAFQMSGGAAGTLQMFGGIVSKLMNPTVALTGAVVALGAGGIYAFDAWQTRLNALQGALNGLGRSTGLSLSGLNNIAMQSAGGRTSTFQAQEAITAFAATGKITPGIMSQLTKPQAGQSDSLIQQYSRGTGSSYSESVKTLASDLASPTKGAEELNKQFGLLSDNQMQMITHLDAGGQRIAAQGAILDALGPRVQGLADITSIWAHAWDGVGTAASNALAGVGRALSPSMADELAALAVKNRPGGSNIEYGNLRRPTNPADPARESSLRQQIALADYAAYAKGVDQVAKEKSLDIGEISRHANPDIDRRQKLIDDRDKLQNAMNTPGALGMTDRNAAQEALDRLNAGVRNFGTSAEIVARDSAASAAATAAFTAQQRTAIEATKAYNDVIREGGGVALAAAESTARWNQALAETQHRLDDETRKSGETRATVGLSPGEREQWEILNRGHDFTRDAVFGPSTLDKSMTIGPLSMADRSMTALDTSGGFADKSLLNYSRNIAPKAGAAGADALWSNYLSKTAPVAGHPASAGAWPSGSVASPAAATPPGYYRPIAGPAQHEMNINSDYVSSNTQRTLGITMPEQVSLDAASRSLQVQKDTWGQMPGVIAEAEAKVKLYNAEIAANVPITQNLLDLNQKMATQSGAQAQDAANWSNITQTVGQVQDMAKSITSGAATDLANTWGAKSGSLVGQLSQKDQMAYYSGHMSGQDVKNRVMMNQVWDLTRQEISKFGIGLAEKGIFGSGSGANATPGLVTPFLNAGVSALGGLFGGVGTFGGNFGAAPTFGFAAGGVMTPQGPRRLPMFASGGTSNGAAIFGEAGPEAAVPLPDGRAIPVAFKKATFGGGSAAMTQHNYSVQGGDINIAGNADEKIIPQMRAEMAASNKALMAQLNRNIGTTTAKWSQRFGN